MSSYADLLSTVLHETLACQDPTTSQCLERKHGLYAPFGPAIPGEAGSYPTTDAAMDALASIADRYRQNDPRLARSVGRDAMRLMVSRVAGDLLPELVKEPEARKRWRLFRERLLARLQSVAQDIVHYVPVWLFLNQECPPFAIGPVRFVEPKDWLDVIEGRSGRTLPWVASVRNLWSESQAGEAARPRDQPEGLAARAVARAVHPDQWIACVEVNGFEREESHRRGVLAARVALDTVRLALGGSSRRLLSTAADSVIPLSVDRLSQVAGQDLARGARINRPGVSGRPRMAHEVVSCSAQLFAAAGACISSAVTSPQAGHACPLLADRWFNAAHWFGRACQSDGDFAAVIMLVIALDVLCGGKEDRGITELAARLTGTAASTSVLQDGTSLEKLVAATYSLRSKVAHGSVMAMHEPLDVERAHLESLAAAVIGEYAVQLHTYAQAGGADDRDAFLGSLRPAPV